MDAERPNRKIVVQLGSDTMGRGDSRLGKKLMQTFQNVLPEDELSPPYAMVLFNSGVKLACNGSELIEPLKDLETVGTTILCCGTCLEYYNLKDQLLVGKTSNMVEITHTMMLADHLVPL